MGKKYVVTTKWSATVDVIIDADTLECRILTDEDDGLRLGPANDTDDLIATAQNAISNEDIWAATDIERHDIREVLE